MRRWAGALVLVLMACKSSNTPAAPTTDDDGPFDPKTAEGLEAIFQQVVDRHPRERSVFLKPHGCATATFEVQPNLPAKYAVGLFKKPGSHRAWVRISSDAEPSSKDQANNTIGFAIKVLDVPGTKLLAGEESFTTHDFLTQNMNVFFSDTAADFLSFNQAAFAGKDAEYLAAHPRTDQILKAMAKPVENVLGSRYWSTTPYRFGPVATDYAKYTLRPCATVAPEAIPPADDNYLRTRLVRDLKAAPACFEFQVQLRTDVSMPLDQATAPWDETRAVPQTTARLTLQQQDIDANQQCESMSFTAWHALPEHRPVGSLNKARQLVYKHLADERRSKNNVPIAEPE